MKKLIYLISVLILFLVSCKTETAKEEKTYSNEELAVLDSISKAEQKVKVDSIKKTNPLLILPPDSTYTGEYTDRYPSGIVKFKGFFRLGKRHGQWLSFYPDGLMWSELHYDKGLREGPNTTYFEGGIVRYTGFYKADVQDSVWTYNDSTGKIAEKVLFKNDRIIKKLPLR